MGSQSRPRTLWPSRDGVFDASGVEPAAPERGPASEDAPGTPGRRVHPSALEIPSRHLPNATVGSTDPWEHYEPRARVKSAFEVILARHRVAKGRLVAVQQVRDADPGASVTQQIQRNNHRSFPVLLDHIVHGPQQYLVWEPWEASLADVLASDCDVTDCEIAEIVWPVLSGITFLRKQGLALSLLTESHVLLMATGSVKIAGAERCQAAPRMDLTPASWQLTALAAMVTRLLSKNKSHRPRNADLLLLPQRLQERSVDELLRDASFVCMSGQGELVALAKLANMTAFRNVEFL